MATYEQGTIAIEVGLNGLLARIFLDLVDSADLGELLLGQGACPDSTVPWDGPLTDITLQCCQVGWRVERHVAGANALDVEAPMQRCVV